MKSPAPSGSLPPAKSATASAAATGGVPGGKQDIWTLGLNWYPNNTVKFQLNYNNLQVAHPNAPLNDISASAIVLRSQFSL